MRFVSTRGRAAPVGIDQALSTGLAPDGGLYVPASLPDLRRSLRPGPPAAVARQVLGPYFAGSRLQGALEAICADAFRAPLALRPLRGPGDHVLELFHGPTAAFKDFAARFLAGALQRLRDEQAPTLTVLVATSGDTGAAIAAAFHDRPRTRVVVLHPDGGVSARQAHSLGCWGPRVDSLRVAGSFDDCQAMVKAVLGGRTRDPGGPLTSANSISLGRLLPQVALHAWAALEHHRVHGRALGLIVPTGNLGNALAAWIARRMGAPIGPLALATNANDTLPRLLRTGRHWPHPTLRTPANAMDVAEPSNLERLRHWVPSVDDMRTELTAQAVDDESIVATIATAAERHGLVPCPHTATALHVLQGLRRAGDRRHWAVVATAHPAKFDTVVEPVVGQRLAVPPGLQAMLARPAASTAINADAHALAARLRTLGA